MGSRRFYSPSTGGFYSETIHGDGMPEDAVRVTEPHYRRLMKAQQEGKLIVARQGKPTAIDPDDDIEELARRNRFRRDRLLQGSDWTQLPDSPLSPAQRAAWAAWRQQLRDMNLARKLPDPDWPSPPTGAA